MIGVLNEVEVHSETLSLFPCPLYFTLLWFDVSHSIHIYMYFDPNYLWFFCDKIFYIPDFLLS